MESATINTLRLLSSFYLFVVALATAIQFSTEFIYASALEVWFILDWFSLIGYALCLVASARYAYAARLDGVSLGDRIISNTMLYISIGLFCAFMHNFVGNLVGNKDDLLFWKFINTVQIPLFIGIGIYFLKKYLGSKFMHSTLLDEPANIDDSES